MIKGQQGVGIMGEMRGDYPLLRHIENPNAMLTSCAVHAHANET